MKTRGFLLVFLMALVPMAISASERVYRIGFLAARSRSTAARPDVYYDGWLGTMRELGYVEGRNLAIEWRFADGNYDRLPALAAELAAMKHDVIVTHGLPPTRALQKATSATPIVFAVVVDPVGNHVVANLARPGGNITGLSLMAEDLNAKRIEILEQLVPNLSRLAVLTNPANPSPVAMLQKIELAAKAFGLSVLPVEARSADEIERALDRSLQGHANGLLFLEDAYLNAYETRIAEWTVRHGMPAMSWGTEFVRAGGLASFGTNLVEFYRRAATLVDKILRGAKPADLPIEQPTKVELLINRKTANAFGLKIPPELLVQADKVIE